MQSFNQVGFGICVHFLTVVEISPDGQVQHTFGVMVENIAFVVRKSVFSMVEMSIDLFSHCTFISCMSHVEIVFFADHSTWSTHQCPVRTGS